MQPKSASAIIIVPKQPFVNWANWAEAISGDGQARPLEYFTSNCSVVLIPKFLTKKEAKEYVLAVWEDIFEQELSRHVDRSLWRQDRTKEMFLEWFDLRFHSTVFTCLLADQ